MQDKYKSKGPQKKLRYKMIKIAQNEGILM